MRRRKTDGILGLLQCRHCYVKPLPRFKVTATVIFLCVLLNSFLWFRSPTSSCKIDIEKRDAFNKIYDNYYWGGSNGKTSRSGPGSDPSMTENWMEFLNEIIVEFNITSVADMACGDANWQFGSKKLNTIDLYVGGDISSTPIEENKILYRTQCNKHFVNWDISSCPLPTVVENECGKRQVERFDLVILKDVIQHVPFDEAFNMIRNIVNSGARYIMTTSYRCEGMNNWNKKIESGEFYMAQLECDPFSFPAPKLKRRSHNRRGKVMTHGEDDDFIYLYAVEDLKTRFDMTDYN